ncbi:MAG: hypothetical protein LM583_09875, partial [Desulfurococcaceae archaeon]|nr:hypothetical protein [Desulfurococcaceae archaeon]
LPEVIDRIKAEVGPKIITGLATELATAVELAATSGLGNVGYGDLAKTVINVPLRVVRVSDVALPPHIQGLLSLKTLFEGLKTVSVWPGNANIKDIYRYANEADAYGLVKLHRDANNIADSLVEPLLGSSLEVVEKVSSVGFNTIIANPSRAWIPILSVYGDATSKFPTTTELIDCDTDLLRILRDTEGFGHERCEEWAKHMLGMNTKRSFKVPALARKSPRTFGVLEIIKFGDEERVLSLTVARRIVAANITVTSLVNVLDEVKQRIEEIIKRGGVYGEILKIISQGGFIERERFERDVRKFLEQYKVEENPNIVIRTLEGFGFIHSTALGYYSAWTITPIGFVDEHGKTVIDENKRLISAWMAKEVFSSKYKDTIMDRIIRRLIEKGEVDIIKEIDDEKTRIAVAKRLGFLEKASLVKTVDESETTIRLTGPEAKKILTVVYLAYYLGMKLPEIPIEEEKKPNLGETLIEVGKKFKIMK